MRNADGLYVRVWEMGDEKESGTHRPVCVRVCLHCDWDAVGGLQCSTHKNTLTLKGLNTQSSSLTQSNLFI